MYMEYSHRLVEFLENKTILVTGATGFLAKVLVEKIIRIQPKVEKLYLVFRAENTSAATQRLHDEVFKKDLFKVIREEWRNKNLNAFVKEKVIAVAGDVSFENLGIKDSYLREEIWREVDLIINSAATTSFDERARMHGWPNSYVFTKAMGEMLLDRYKDDLCLVIIRPPIITSTYKEPFSGWIEGLRTIDIVLVCHGRGKITLLHGNSHTVIDMLPVDMVVNNILMAILAHANENGCLGNMFIYQMGSSLRNPIKLRDVFEFNYRYFNANPWIDGNGRPIKVDKFKLFNSKTKFHMHMITRYMLPLKGLRLVNTIVWGKFCGDTYNVLNRKLTLLMRMVEFYRPYTLFQGVFDDRNTEKLRMEARNGRTGVDPHNSDPTNIEWEDYICNIHIPGLLRYASKL